MTPAEVRAAMDAKVVVVDTRPLVPFAAAHLPGALHIEFNLADLADRAELLVPKGVQVIVHAEPEGTVAASVGLLGDAGLHVLGDLEGGLGAWQAAGQPVEPLPLIATDRLWAELDRYLVLDVREPYEFRHGHLSGAQLLPSGDAWTGATPAAHGRPIAVFCSGHARAAFVASLLLARGTEAALVTGGMYEWLQHGYPVAKGAAP